MGVRMTAYEQTMAELVRRIESLERDTVTFRTFEVVLKRVKALEDGVASNHQRELVESVTALIDHIDRKYIAMKASQVSDRAMTQHSILRDLSLAAGAALAKVVLKPFEGGDRG
jgi:hypothetical protein